MTRLLEEASSSASFCDASPFLGVSASVLADAGFLRLSESAVVDLKGVAVVESFDVSPSAGVFSAEAEVVSWFLVSATISALDSVDS